MTKKVLPPGKGHWIQQEAPEEVHRLILESLSAQAPTRQGVVSTMAELDH